MTRDDAVELIQRDLDEDLTAEEKHRLHLLLQNDSELQLIYDRLKRVSDELAQLPLVTPRFSLVDAILPQLETAAFETARVGLSREPQLPRLEPKKQEQLASRKPRRLPLWAARAGSGVAAACILFGMVVMVTGTKDKKEPDATSGANTGAVVQPIPEKQEPTAVPPEKVSPNGTKDGPAKNQTTPNTVPINPKSGTKSTVNNQNPAHKPPQPNDHKLVTPPVVSTSEKDKARGYKDDKRDPEDRKLPLIIQPIKGNETEREVNKQKKNGKGTGKDQEDDEDHPGNGKDKNKKERKDNDDHGKDRDD